MASEKQLAVIKQDFVALDPDNSGCIDKSQLEKMLQRQLNRQPTAYEVSSVQGMFSEEKISLDRWLEFLFPPAGSGEVTSSEVVQEAVGQEAVGQEAVVQEDAFAAKYKPFEEKMLLAELSEAARKAFKANFKALVDGVATTIPELDITPAADIPSYDSLTDEDPTLLARTVVVKLNGGLGTGMGLEKAKSLLKVKGEDTFLDFIAKQVIHMREKFNSQDLRFMFMNSFSTSDDTKAYLKKYEEQVGAVDGLEFVQNKCPKIAREDLSPAEWPAGPENEWCPPGHGDLYPALLGSGTLGRLLEDGKKYMFVSNSDNLGASLDLKLLTHFASSGVPFMMEVAVRTDADKKGGHLCRKKDGNKLCLRESAQCAKEDEAAFQDTSVHKYFNTNNLWIDLEKLKAVMDANDGAMPLALIKNQKTVDPRDSDSLPVFQLETAMGAAIESFEGAAAICIPRTRFSPVKTCDDLFALRSNAYVVTEDYRLELDSSLAAPPNITLDGYKFVDQLEELVPEGYPDMLGCKKLQIKGKYKIYPSYAFKEEEQLVNEGESCIELK